MRRRTLAAFARALPAASCLPPPQLLARALLPPCQLAERRWSSSHRARERCSPLLPPAAQLFAAPPRAAHTGPAAGSSTAPAGLREEEEEEQELPSWVDRVRPAAVVPFLKLARLDKPVGTWLLFWPCAWSLALAAPSAALPDASLLALFGAGAVLLRGAGCTINDWWDADLDRRVRRTRRRPIAAGDVSSAAALGFLGLQLTLGLGILLQLDPFAQAVGAASLPLVGLYPLAKRVTHWPQAVLGLTFNWGVLLGWAAVHHSLHLPVVLPLYAAGAAWTLVYDTIYAHQDAADDARVGVRSTALRFGSHTKAVLSAFSLAMLAGLAAAGQAAGLGAGYYGGLGLVGGHLAWQLASVDIGDRADCGAKFRANAALGGLVFAACIAGKLTQAGGALAL